MFNLKRSPVNLSFFEGGGEPTNIFNFQLGYPKIKFVNLSWRDHHIGGGPATIIIPTEIGL